jgi:dipeptidyl aminopeptidase/acylaminoacyl peptidase
MRRLLLPLSLLLAAPAGCAHRATCPTPPATEAPAALTAPAAPPSGPTVVTQGALRLEGTPTVPEALRAAMFPYLEVRSADLAAVSDDGKAMLVATRFGATSQLHLVSTPLGARRQVTFGLESVRSGAFVPGRRDAFVFSRDVGGNENYQLYLADLAAGTTTLLTDGQSRHGGFAFSDDGRRLAYTSNARNGRDMDVWVLDLASPADRRVAFEVSGSWNVAGFTPDGARLVMVEFFSIEKSRVHVGELATRSVEHVTASLPDTSIRGVAQIPGSSDLLVLSNHTGEFVGLHRATRGAGGWTFRELPTGLAWDLEHLAVSPDGKRAAFAANADGASTLHLLDLASGKITAGPDLGGDMVAGLAWAKRADTLALTVAGPTRSGDAWSWDSKKGALTAWTESELAGLDPKALIRPTNFRYPSFDGRQIPAFIYRPTTPGPHAVVINIHGGPESQSRPYLSPAAQHLARSGSQRDSGVATIFPNVRGSDGYGKTWLSLDNGRLREDSVKDIGALLDWIATQPDLDASRVAVMGGSYGGYMVLASLVHYSDRLKAGIDVVGISDFVTFLENTAEYRRALRRAEYGDESDPAMRDFLRSISPLTHVDRIRSALFVAHGANDPRVPLSEAEQIAAAVRAAGKDVWLMVASNEGHGFSKRENRDMYLWLSVMFLEKHLKPAP